MFFQPNPPYAMLRNKLRNPTHIRYVTFWNCYLIFYWKRVQKKAKQNKATEYDNAKILWFTRVTRNTLRRLTFEEIYLHEIRFLLDYFSWIYSRGNKCRYISSEKFSRIVKVLQFYVDFIFVVAKYAFLTSTVPMVEIERLAALLPKLKSIN